MSYYIDGGLGADTMQGSTSNDSYVVDNPNDRVVEPVWSPYSYDIIRSSVAYELPDNVEALTMTGTAAIDGWGNELSNHLDGSQNAAVNHLYGGIGHDYYIVGANDIVVEAPGAGTDTVEFHGTGTRTYLRGDLPANVEGLALGDDLGASDLQGSSGDDTLTGNASNNVITGGAGDDTLWGGDGTDTLIGGTGDDTMLGGPGVNSYLFGKGFGNDSVADTPPADGRLGPPNHIMFDATVAPDDIYFAGGKLHLHGTDDELAIHSYADITFSDGSAISETQVGMLLYASNSSVASAGNDLIYGTEGGNQIDALAGDDFVYGYGGNDTLAGNAGDDQVSGGAGDDAITGGDGNDQLQGDAGNDTIDGGAGNDTVHGGVGNDTIDGGTERDTLYGDAGDDTLRGGGDVDQLFGGDGNDLLVGGDPSDPTDIVNTLDGGNGNDTLVGGDGIDTLSGGDGNDTLDGNAGDDQISGGAGNDLLRGGDGVDYLYDVDGDDVLEGGAGDDSLAAGNGNDVLDGGAGNDYLNGGPGTDTYVLKTGSGVDIVADEVLLTNDKLIIQVGAELHPSDVSVTREDIDSYPTLVISANGGADALQVGGFIDASRPAEIHFGDGTIWDSATVLDKLYVRRGTAGNDTLVAGTGDFQLYGFAGNDTLTGGAGYDLLDGGSGADNMTGGGGVDTFMVDDPGDIVVESISSYATVNASISYVLPNNVQALVLTGSAAINGTGNSLVNKLTGNTGANILDGKAGADTMIGGAGNDTYVVDNVGDIVTELTNDGTDAVQAIATYTLGANLENLTLTGSSAINGSGNAADNVLTGNSAANTLTGGLGNDQLNGGSGIDTMKGGAGNETYTVDNSSDVVTELANEGTDLVLASTTYTLGSNVENLTLTGASSINGTGNILNNKLTGNSGNNTLSGATGADTMAGSLGNDTYVVDNVGDVVTENASEGTDLVQSSISYVLAANVENVTLTGTAAINATGNTFNNTLTGNTGNNILDGGTGTDTLIGGTGNDTYVVDAATDVVTEAAGAGTDLVQSAVTLTLAANVENLTLTGTAAINGSGNTLNNVLTGNGADNVLAGGAGNDTLIGGAGNDTYVVDAATDVVTEAASAGNDAVQASIGYTLSSNVEYLTLTGTTAINGTGNTLDNWLQGSAAVNTLDGGSGNDTLWGAAGDDTLLGSAGNDLLQGGLGNDALSDAAGNNVLDGGAGIDTLTGGTAHEMLIGGTGNDTINTGGGADVIAFNKGDGADVVNASVGTDDTLTLGGGLAYSDLKFKKTGLDLILDANNGDQITFKNWYQTGANDKSVLNLQVIADAMAAFNPTGTDPLLNKKVVTFNFAGLVGKFDAALVANPGLTSWSLTTALSTYYLSGSDTAAIGADFSYDYGHRNALTNIGATPGQAVLSAGTFGSAAQTLQSPATLYAGTVRLQ